MAREKIISSAQYAAVSKALPMLHGRDDDVIQLAWRHNTLHHTDISLIPADGFALRKRSYFYFLPPPCPFQRARLRLPLAFKE